MSATDSEPEITTRYVYRYHNDSLPILSILVLGILLLIGALGFFIFVQLSTEPKPLHFKLNPNLQIIDPVPLDQEGISTPALLNWVNEVVMQAYNFNYSNMPKQQSRLTPYFSEIALKVYSDLFTNDDDFKTIVDNKYVVSVTPKAAPEIIVSKSFQGRFAWQIQIPVRIVLSNALMRAYQEATLTYLIWRVPETQNPLGITVVTFTHKVSSRLAPQGVLRNNL
jgi:intracellular multiplication protein IcmL